MAPVRWQIDGPILRITCEGEYAVERMFEAWAEAVEDPGWPEITGALADLRRSRSLVRRPVADLRRTSSYFTVELARHDITCALLVEGAVRYGLMRMVASWIPGGVRVRVFRNEGKALAWLNTTRMTANG